MKKVALIYNPLSGTRSARRLLDVKAAVKVLRNAGLEVVAAPTQAASQATPQVAQAIAEGCDTIFACGGDGTVHDILQGMVGSQVHLGIIPLGTANAMAHDLGLPLSAAGAARAALTAKPRRIAVGRVTYRDRNGSAASRYFTVTLGVGVDAHLFYRLNALAKVRFGMAAYYGRATWLWLTHQMQNFAVEFRDQNGQAQQADVTELLAVRIRNFGGVLRELAPGASLDRDDLRLVLCKTRSRTAYLAYVVRGMVGAQWKIRGIDLAHTASLTCRRSTEGQRIYVEADGEILGTLPAEIEIVPDAVTILVPDRGGASSDS